MDEIQTEIILINRQIGIVESRLKEKGLSTETISWLNQRRRELEAQREGLKKKK